MQVEFFDILLITDNINQQLKNQLMVFLPYLKMVTEQFTSFFLHKGQATIEIENNFIVLDCCELAKVVRNNPCLSGREGCRALDFADGCAYVFHCC